MKTVLHLTSSFGLGGGAEANLVRLVSHMDGSRFRSAVVTMTEGVGHQSLAKMLENSGVAFFSLKMRRGVPSAAAAARLLKIVRRLQPQILQTWMYHADLLGTIIGQFARVPALAWNLRCSSLSTSDPRRRSRAIVRVLARLSFLPRVILANSQAGIEYHRSIGYAPRSWQYIPNSLDTSVFCLDPSAACWLRAQLKLDADTQLVGLVGRFHPAKDHSTFISAAETLATQWPRVQFVLAGTNISKDNDHLMRLINATGFADRFHLLGHRTDVSRITAALDISCSSSISEGSSNVIAEAMACGVPCVVTDVGDSALVLGNSGKIVAAQNPAALARACHELLDLPTERRATLGAAARARAEECFSLRSVVAQYEQLYDRLLPQHSALLCN